MNSQIMEKHTSSNAYAPGLNLKDLKVNCAKKRVINLASNESPFNLNKTVVDYIQRNITGITRYPDNDGIELKMELGKHLGVDIDSLLLGNGSTEVLYLIGKSFLYPAAEVIYSEYSFVAYKMIAEAMGAKSIVTPSKNWGHDLDGMLDSITPSTKLIFIDNPNNPTGTRLTERKLIEFIHRVPDSVIIVLDEAYYEFADQNNFSKLIKKYSNLIVTRTFSKAYGLAGIRLGYAIANKALISLFNKSRLPYSINSLALIAGQAAIKDTHYLNHHILSNNEQKFRLYEEFERIGIEYIPSSTNFIALDTGSQGQNIYNSLAEKGILVRPLNSYGMLHHLRVTIGADHEMDEFIREFKSIF